MSNKTAVVILSAGGTAREAVHWISEDCTIIGFLDDIQQGTDIIGTLDQAMCIQNHHFISCLGSVKSMKWRQQFLEKLPIERFLGLNKALAIYSTANIHSSSIIFPGAIISHNSQLGKHSLIYHHAIISHDAVIGDYSIVSNGAVVSGNVIIGNSTYVGANSTILDGICIGENCVIAAGATVLSDVPPYTIYISEEKKKPNHYWQSQ